MISIVSLEPHVKLFGPAAVAIPDQNDQVGLCGEEDVPLAWRVGLGRDIFALCVDERQIVILSQLTRLFRYVGFVVPKISAIS